ncbi:MAG: hypothetical protein RL497_1657 [Pseudomonadota bacterium]|jgi:hypothetical protein
MIRNALIYLAITFAFLGCSAEPNSDFGTLNNEAPGQSKILTDSGSGLKQDLFVPAKANKAGISFNSTAKFDVQKTLKIINTSNIDPNTNAELAAKVIIIQSAYINLASTIEIVGVTADILLISNASSTNFKCTSCTFKNIGRLTLAHGVAKNINSNITAVGQIDLGAVSGTMAIGSLTAPGAVSLEILSNYLELTGTINTNQRASNHPAGGLELNPNGPRTIVSGGINVYTSDIAVTYENAQIAIVRPKDRLITLGGQLNAASVNIKSAAPLVLETIISTRGDALANSVYRGAVAAVSEGVVINTIADDKSQISHLTLNKSISTDGTLAINASGNVTVGAPVWANQFHVTAMGKTLQRATVKTDITSVSATSFENNGLMRARIVNVYAENEIQNRFGGAIFSDTVNLTSQLSYVRNGSLQPFRPANGALLLLQPDQSSTSDLSTFELENLNTTGATKVTDLSARIAGKNIQISAATNVENINPYFVFTKNADDWTAGIPFDVASAARVAITAENSLKIKAGNYVVNSSALMAVNSYSPATTENGSPVSATACNAIPQLGAVITPFYIDAQNVANERYMVKALMDTDIKPPTTSQNGSLTTTEESKNLVSNLYVYSPPGIMYSFAPIGIKLSAAGEFINNAAYFEILSDSYFMGDGKVSSLGLALEKQNFYSAQSVIREASECMHESTSEGFGRCTSVSNSQSSSNGTTIKNDLQNTLFAVAGKTCGVTTRGEFKNHEVLKDIKSDVLTSFMETLFVDTRTVSISTGGLNVSSGPKIVKTKTTAALSEDGKQVIVTQSSIYSDDIQGNNAGPEENLVIGTYPVWDTLVTKLTEIKIAFMQTLDSFIAWLNG